MSSHADLEDQLAAAKAELDEINQIEEDDPSQFDDELRLLQQEARAKVDEIRAQITAGVAASSGPIHVESQPVPAPAPPLQAVAPPPPTPQEPLRVYRVNDTVTAKYKGDKNFYTATVVGVTGSASDPVYTVKFKGYTGTEKVRAHEIRAISHTSSATQKRKADDSPAASTSNAASAVAPVAYNSSVITVAPSVDPALVSAVRKQTNRLADPEKPPEKRLKKTAKKLEQGKQNWQSFQQSGMKGKAAKLMNKQSMFRTGESATARVGFTGSGTAMREDTTRSRHTYGNLEPDR